MPSAIVRFRPTGPWRFGPDSGTRDRVDLIYHSDTLYAAVTSAMLRLNLLNEWLDATARHSNGEPQVRFSSLFPFQRDILFVTPPRNLWPPPASTKIRYKSARFVPLNVVKALVAEQPIDENRWIIDGESQCMIPSGEGPFRIGLRSAAAIDRVNPAALDPHVTACIEFARDAGLWTMVVFANEEAQGRWKHRVRGALRLLADTGFGGERSRGWGRSSEPEWQKAPELWPAPETDNGHWMLSVYAPAASDNVDWKTGNYSTLTRTGRIESVSQWGGLKAPSLMIAEGSVLVAPDAPRGEARDVAPEGFAHSVYRAGFGVSIPIPWKAPGTATPVFSAQKPVAESKQAVPVVAPVVEPEVASEAPPEASSEAVKAEKHPEPEMPAIEPEAVHENVAAEPAETAVEPEVLVAPEEKEAEKQAEPEMPAVEAAPVPHEEKVERAVEAEVVAEVAPEGVEAEKQAEPEMPAVEAAPVPHEERVEPAVEAEVVAEVAPEGVEAEKQAEPEMPAVEAAPVPHEEKVEPAVEAEVVPLAAPIAVEVEPQPEPETPAVESAPVPHEEKVEPAVEAEVVSEVAPDSRRSGAAARARDAGGRVRAGAARREGRARS